MSRKFRFRPGWRKICHSLLAFTFVIGTIAPSVQAQSNEDENYELPSSVLENLLKTTQEAGLNTGLQNESHTVKVAELGEQAQKEEMFDEIIIRFKDSVTDEQKNSAIKEVTGQVVAEDNDRVLISIPKAENWLASIKTLQANQSVQYAEPNVRLKAQSIAPNDPEFASQWALGAIEAEQAWEKVNAVTYGAEPATTPSTVVVAVIDSGVDVNHPDLSGRLLPGFNMITGADEGNYADESGHGTSVAGIIAATSNNEIGISGAAGTFPVQILPIKVLNGQIEGTLYDVAAAVERATGWVGTNGEKVKVINLSLGFREWLGEWQFHDEGGTSLGEAIQNAQNQGIVVVAAAGNDGIPVQGGNDGPPPYYPANYDGVISVGALGENGEIREDSNPGATLVAPGENILSTMPNGVYGTQTGTSFAAPYVSAAAGLMMMANPNLSSEQIRHSLVAGLSGNNWSMNRSILEGLPGSDSEPPEWPEDSTLSANVDVNRMTLQWPNAVGETGAIHYVLFQNGVPLSGYQTSPIEINGLIPNTEYSFKVEAIDTWGNQSQDGPSITVTTNTAGEAFEKISRSKDSEISTGESFFGSVSEDGRWIAFSSHANNLVDGDTNGLFDIFVYDREKREMKRISLAFDGSQANGHSYAPIISMDGRFVLFTSRAGNLTKDEDYNGSVEDLFLYDISTSKMEKVANDVSAIAIYNYLRNDRPFAMSANGRYIAYASKDENGDQSDSNGTWDVFVTDRLNNTTKRLTDRLNKNRDARPSAISITPDGRFVAYTTENANDILSLFIYDARKDSSEEEVMMENATETRDHIYSPSISADGRYVAFTSHSNKLIPNDESWWNLDVFVRDRKERTTEIVSTTLSGGPSDDYNDAPWISANGRYVVFHSQDELDPRSTRYIQIYMHDRQSHETKLVSGSPYNDPGENDSVNPFITQNGRYVVFESLSINLGLELEEDDWFTDIYFKSLHLSDAPVPVWNESAELNASQVGAHYVVLNWDSASNESDGELYYRLYEGERLVDIVQGNSYLVTNLNPSTNYRFSVQVGDGSFNWSTQSLKLETTTMAERETTAPGTILNPILNPEHGKLSITWKDPVDSDFIGAKVLWRKMGTTTFRETPIIYKGVEESEINGLINGTLYEIVFISIDADGNESQSSVHLARMPAGPQTVRVSISNDFEEGNDRSSNPDVSDDGRYIVFSSHANNLVEGDTNNTISDIFLYDRETEKLQLISKTVDGFSTDHHSFRPRISGDGRFIVFDSEAKNLTEIDDNDYHADIFLYDRDADGDGKYDEPGGTSIKEITANGVSGASFASSINSDGTVIAFESSARDLVPADTWGTDVYLYDVKKDKITKVELKDGSIPNNSSHSPSISGNGDYLAFLTKADNLDSADMNKSMDVYLYQISTKTIERISKFSDEGVLITDSFWPTVNDDGRYVAFHYYNHSKDNGPNVYVYDRNADPANAMKLVSVTSTGEPAGDSFFPSISGNGKYVAFQSQSNAMVEGDSNSSNNDIFVYDLVTGSTKLITRSYNGSGTNDSSETPVLSYDGSVVVFASQANNLISDDFNFNQDIYWAKVEASSTSVPEWPTGSNVTVSDKGETYVTLSWTPANANQGVSSYKILYGDNKSQIVSGINTTYKVTGLEPGTTYTFKIEAANDSDQWTENGPSIVVETLEESNLSDLILEELSDARIKLTWEIPSPDQQIIGYEIYRKTGEEAAIQVGTVNDPNVNFFIDEAENMTSYTYYVMATNSTGEKHRYSLEKTITTSGFSIDSIRYTTPLEFKRYATVGANLDIVALGDKGLSVQAVIQYESIQGAVQEVTVDLEETKPGNYVGSKLIPDDAAQIKSIKAVASKNGMTEELTGSQNPVLVGGSVTFEVTTEFGDLPEDSYLSVTSTNKKIYTGMTLEGSGTYTLDGLPASGDYDYQITTVDGTKLELLNKEPISVKYGQISENKIVVRLYSTFHGKVIHKDENEQSNAQLYIKNNDHYLYSKNIKINNNQEFTLPGLKAGDELMIEVRPEEAHLGYFVQKVVLQPGENVLDIELQTRKKATLVGQVTDLSGLPVSRAKVHAEQWFGSKRESTETITDENGRYTFELLEGTTMVYALVPGGVSTKTVEVFVENGKENKMDLAFTKPLPGLLELDILTKHIGGEWTSLDLDWRVLVHFRFSISHSRRDNSPGGLLSIYSEPGDVVKVCIDGLESNLPKACGETTMDASNRGKIELRLEQTGSQVKAKLEGSPSWPSYRGTLYSVDEDDKRSYVTQKMFGTDLMFDIHKPGKYHLELSSYGYNAYREFEIAAGEIKELGTIELLGPGSYSGRPGNIVMTSPAEVLPGSLIQIRNHYLNSSSQETSNTQVLLEIPAGTKLVENSILVDGKPAVASKVESNEFVVDLGTVQPKGSGTVAYHLRVEEDYDQPNISVIQRISFTRNGEKLEERLGGATAQITRIKLDAPSVTGRKDLTVSGVAPAGSIVTVYDNDLLLGRTVASATGSWKQTIRLTSADTTSEHSLRAEAERREEKWMTEVVPVTYEHDHPEIVNVKMNQWGERSVSFDPGQGVAVFPYVYVPGRSFSVSLDFQNDVKVSDVKVQVGDGESKMGKGSNGTYTAIVSPSKPGPVYVTYNVKKNVSFSKVPTQGEYEEQIPQQLRNIEWTEKKVTQSQTDPYHLNASVAGAFTVKERKYDMGVNISFESVEYSPTSNDTSWTSMTGLSVHGFSFDYSISGNTLSYSVSGYIPESQFQQVGAAGALQAVLSGVAGTETETVVRGAAVLKYIKVAYKGFLKLGDDYWDSYEVYDDIDDTIGNKDKLKQLEELIDKAAMNCEPEAARQYIDEANSIANKYMAQEVLKWTMIAAGAAVGPATFGVGTLLLFGATEFLEAVMDRAIELQIEELKKKMENDDRCEEDPEKERKEVADPKWIYDPSGYVYEVEESNRVEGVTAVAMYWEETEQTWKPWDAEWYGQINPQVTGRDGKYAWDVPEGKWKVVFSKEGYLTAESDELIVLPPHTDVNIALVSLLPPGKLEVVAEPGGHSIDIIFDRYVIVDAVNDATITVAQESEQQEMASVKEVTAVGSVDYKGIQVAKRFKLAFTESLKVGEDYKITASQGIQSYNEVPTRKDIVGKVAIPDKDMPPAEVSDVETFGGLQEIALQWKDPNEPDLDHIKVSWKKESQQAYSESLKVNKGEEYALLSALTAGTNYDIKIEAVDAGGNKSENLLKVSTTIAAPEIDLVPPRAVENVTVTADGTQLKVSWSEVEAEDLAHVVIRWKELDSNKDWQAVQVKKGTGKYSIAGLKANTSYEITVKAMDAVGNESEGWLGNATTKSSGQSNPPGGTPPSEPPVDPEVPSSDEAKIELNQNGGVYKVHDDRFRLNIQANVFKDKTIMMIMKNLDPLTKLTKGFSQITPTYKISLGSKDSLKKPIAISIQYEPSTLKGVDYRKLGIYRQDEADPKKWTYIGGTVDPSNNKIFTNIKELGTYAVLIYQKSFSDMQKHWSKADVEVLVSRHFVNGVNDEKFQPNRSITRAEFTKLLVNFVTKRGGTTEQQKEISFKDVPSSAWYAGYVTTAVKLGLVQGSNGYFNPNDDITREQMVVMIIRALGISDEIKPQTGAILEKFRDGSQVGEWARDAMAYAIKLKIIKGTNGSQIDPKESTTRAQAAVILLRVLDHDGLISAESPF